MSPSFVRELNLSKVLQAHAIDAVPVEQQIFTISTDYRAVNSLLFNSPLIEPSPAE